MSKEEIALLKQKTATDVTLVGYMLFLNEKGLLKEAKEFVEGFIKSLTQQELTELLMRNKRMLEQAGTTNDATRGS